MLGLNGSMKDFRGDSSVIVVQEALKFIDTQARTGRKALTVIWFPSPHEPWVSLDEDRKPHLGYFKSRYYGEVQGLDRSIGMLRKGLRQSGVENTTLLWFCSDNGGYHGLPVDSGGGLKGYKKESVHLQLEVREVRLLSRPLVELGGRGAQAHHARGERVAHCDRARQEA